jgi:hypothetical protein
MNKLILLLGAISCFLFSCKENEEKSKPSSVKIENKKPIDTTKLIENYFSAHEKTPFITINNMNDNHTKIRLDNHIIKWKNTKQEETIITIDGNEINIEDKITLNDVVDTGKDSVNFINDWSQAKLYRYDDGKKRDIIVITMVFNPCTGLGCSVEYVLVYDTTHKSANFFGSFRGNSAQLYNFGDGKLSYVSSTYKGDFHGENTEEFIQNLYELNKNGLFDLKVQPNKEPYFIKHTHYPPKTNKPDLFEQKWIVDIK